MTQPNYSPLAAADRVRPVGKLPTPAAWWAERPGDPKGPMKVGPSGARFGMTGPDQGYGLHLAERFQARLVLAPGETAADATAGCLGVALCRASAFDRAPVIFDLEMAFTLWGFLGEPPADLVAWRRSLFSAAAHDYWAQREIAARVLPETLRLTPAQVRSRLSDWRSLIDTSKR
ncbi:MAG: hypothetical protein ACRDY2_06820 [Acidimicrobiales bacterium]